MWSVGISSNDSEVTLEAYPSFVTGAGVVQTTANITGPDASKDNADTRQISTYIPWSAQENPITRQINVIIINDGFESLLDIYAYDAFDSVVCEEKVFFLMLSIELRGLLTEMTLYFNNTTIFRLVLE